MEPSNLSAAQQTEITKTLIFGGYNVAAGGIPPHARLLEDLVADKPLDKLDRQTFTALESSNLLTIPGLTYFEPGFAERTKADAYFGKDFVDEMIAAMDTLGAIAGRGNAATLNWLLEPEGGPDFTPLAETAVGDYFGKLAAKGYVAKSPELGKNTIGHPGSVYGLSTFTFNNGGRLTKAAYDAIDLTMNRWFNSPLLEIGAVLHIRKTWLMLKIFRYAVDKTKDLGFADVGAFDIEKYFDNDHNSPRELPAWEASFQNRFGRPIPGASGLLEWGSSAMAAAAVKYSTKI